MPSKNTMIKNRPAPNYWTSLLKRLSTSGSRVKLNRLIIGTSMVLIMVILVLPYLLVEPILKEGQATKTVYAHKGMQIEDVEQTRLRREAAQRSVSPVYREIPGASSLVKDRVVTQQEEIRDIVDSRVLSVGQKRQQLSTIFETTPEKDRQIVITTMLSENTWAVLPQATNETVQAMLRKGVTVDDYQQRPLQFVKGYLPANVESNPALGITISTLVAKKLRPTVTIDEELTNLARKKTVESVEPVIQVYTSGDLIVQKGDVPSEAQIEALRRQGLLMNENRLLHILGVCLLTVGFLFTIWGYIAHFERKTYFKPNYCSLLSTLLVITLGGMVVWNKFSPEYLFLYPVPILAFMVTIFISGRVAIFVSMMAILLGCLGLQIPLEMMAILSLSCLAGIVTLLRRPVPKDRFDILNAGFAVGVVQAVTLLIMSLIYQPLGGPDIAHVALNIVLNIASGLLSGVLTLGALPLFETWFKLITPFTLLELSKLDNVILKRMQIEAPGTFHHSLIISTIAEAAAESIGANGLLARVGALYHDIGKIKRPLFFVENQAYFGSENPHDKLSCRLSKMIVIAHPRDGVEMGRKLGLPEQILAFMPEHHGTMLVGYFYNKAILEEGEENVDEAQYRYPGPKPQSKETAIVMMADACESATRALRSPTQAQLEERIDKIIKQRIDDHQFSEAPITLKEIQMIRDTFVRVLRGMQHNRIEYQQAVIKDFSKSPQAPNAAPMPAPYSTTLPVLPSEGTAS